MYLIDSYFQKHLGSGNILLMNKSGFNYKDIVDHAKDVIIVTKAFPLDDPGPEIVYVNKAFTELTGYSENDVMGKTPRILQSDDTNKESTNAIRKGLEQEIPVRVTLKNISKSGKLYWLDLSIIPLKNNQGIITHFAAIERDITEQKKVEFELQNLARTDPLTGLHNRRSFTEFLENELVRYKRSTEKYSLLMLDIDHFKRINDTYGHDVGDIAIQTLAKTCVSALRLHDKAARIGGEEFCIILPYTTKNEAYAIAERLRENIAKCSIATATEKIFITVSIGVSEVMADDTDYTTILKRADEKMYHAKYSGRNRTCI